MNYIRNKDKVLPNLVVNNVGQLITKADCVIHCPTRFTNGSTGLGQISTHVFILGFFPIIIKTGEYAVCNINALVEINPSKITKITIDDLEYDVFHFYAGDVVIQDMNVVKRDTLMYNIMDELVFKGKIPWFATYEDMGKLFDTASKYGASKVGNTPEIIEFIASIITRDKRDRSKYIRHTSKTYQDTELKKITYVPLKSIFYSVNNTVNKLCGSYFNDGVVSALVNPNDKVDTIEKILRA